ncbi:glycine-rich RNA-binding protein RZ1C-like, partial [Lycium ferocissimum]|uniref:glycine-rich RNA-binding protein RZ1C-like n=1 Tax=Lycium ferocissimum TaxID=112874 RepID=UPI0028155D29
MTIARIQAHAQNLEEQHQSQKSERYFDRSSRKRARSFGARSEDRGGQAREQSSVSSPQYSSRSGQMRPPPPRCNQCGRMHSGQCRLGSDACYACGQMGHKMRDCPSLRGRGEGQPTGSVAGSSSSVRPPGQTSQAPAGRGRGRGGAPSSAGPPHRIYSLAGRQDPEPSTDAAT